MCSNKAGLFFVLFGSVLSSNSVLADKSPGQVMDDAWSHVCPNAASGSDLEDRCAGIGRGDSAGIEAGNGNNAGISSGVGNSTIYSDRAHKKAVEERQDKLEKQRAAGDRDILLGERFGFFASGKLTEIERESTVLETGYESDMQGFTLGVDYFFTNEFVAGLAVGYTNTDLDYNRNSGSSDYENVSVLTYGNYQMDESFAIDGYLGWSGLDYDLKRNISYDLTCGCDVVNSTARGDTEADKILAGLNFSYTLGFGAIEFTPLLKLDYSGTFIDSFSESGGDGFALKYDSQNVQSFKSNLGFNSTYAISFPWGVLLPRMKAGYVHEFLNNRRTIRASFVEDTSSYGMRFKTDKPDRDYFVIGGGVSTVLAHSVQLFVDYERVEGNRYLNDYTVSGGVRVAF